MFRLGAIRQQRLDQHAQQGLPPPSLHSARFYPDAKEALRTGVIAMTAAVENLLPWQRKKSTEHAPMTTLASARSKLTWLLLYLLAMAAILTALARVRTGVLRQGTTPAARADWQAWREAARQQAATAGPVQRRPPRSLEPPAVILLRDHYAACAATVVGCGSIVFLLTAVALRALGQKS